MSEEIREVWITDRPVTDGPGKYNVVAIRRGMNTARLVAPNVDRDDAMKIVAVRAELQRVLDNVRPMSIDEQRSIRVVLGELG